MNEKQHMKVTAVKLNGEILPRSMWRQTDKNGSWKFVEPFTVPVLTDSGLTVVIDFADGPWEPDNVNV